MLLLFFRIGCTFLTGLLWIAMVAVASVGSWSLSALEVPRLISLPHYTLRLTLNEFSILNMAEMDGLIKYGGSGDFQLKMAKEGSNVVWIVSVDNPRLTELLGIFLGEKTMNLVQGLDPNNIDPNQKIALEAIKSLSQKLNYAQNNPVWDSVTISGLVVQQGTNWVIQSKQGINKLVGGNVEELKSRNGRGIVAHGFVKVPGQFDVTRFLDKKDNTLEIFVMSFCPFGQNAETSLYTFLSQARTSAVPLLEIHYLFYKSKKDGRDTFTSLHGEEEVAEDLVQMAIRDYYAQYFRQYIALRAGSKLPWQKLAEQVGLKDADIATIQSIVTSSRDSMIQKEYDYATGKYEIFDGSPSYVWESQRVTDLNNIEPLKGLDGSSQEACNK